LRPAVNWLAIPGHERIVKSVLGVWLTFGALPMTLNRKQRSIVVSSDRNVSDRTAARLKNGMPA
jgi:hypothetical protein